MAFYVRAARESDLNEIALMCALLWPDASAEEHASYIGVTVRTGKSGTLPGVILVACEESGIISGFIDVGLRSHADGCDPTRPVGYAEGWFVHEEFRGRGVGRELMRAAEDWARSQGCLEMASDTWISSEGSQRAHAALGFEVVDRCVHFRKSL
jgi:aminoglycoside 6'-N-acetyltransferase I